VRQAHWQAIDDDVVLRQFGLIAIDAKLQPTQGVFAGYARERTDRLRIGPPTARAWQIGGGAPA
jgi:hypothetical protein